MHFQSHLFSNEIIGFLAGHSFTHKNGKQAIYIQNAYPINALENTGKDRSKSVEMDCESSNQVKVNAEKRGQVI